MGLQEFKKIISQFPDLRRLKIQGIGEPLMNDEIYDMISYSKTKGVGYIYTYTNGSLFNKNNNAKRLIDSGIDVVRISIDSGLKGSFEELRPGSDFLELIRGVENFSLLALKNRQPIVEIWSVITKKNIDQLTSIIDLSQKLSIKIINCQIIMNSFDYKSEVGQKIKAYKVSKPMIEHKIINAIQYAQEKKIKLVIQNSKSHSSKNPCHWPFDSTFISVEGFVVPCCTIADPSVINFGNIFTKTLKEIWGNPQYNQFRQSILTNHPIRPCQNCYS